MLCIFGVYAWNVIPLRRETVINVQNCLFMREIKFRAQDIASNEWLYGDIRHHKDDVCIFEQGGTKGKQVKSDTVGQFTGFTDKDGREIYEGDILRGDYYPYHDGGVDNYLGVVFFDCHDCDWEVMKLVTAKSERRGISNVTTSAFCNTDFLQMEVIGNVWDSKGMFRDPDEEVIEWFNAERSVVL